MRGKDVYLFYSLVAVDEDEKTHVIIHSKL